MDGGYRSYIGVHVLATITQKLPLKYEFILHFHSDVVDLTHVLASPVLNEGYG